MSTLSLLLRISSVFAATIAVVFYFRGGNQLKKLTHELEAKQSLIDQQTTEIAERVANYERIKSELDSTAIELATLKRDQRLRGQEVKIVRRELNNSQRKIEEIESLKLTITNENDKLRRENIDLKTSAFDPQKTSEIFQSRIARQRNRIQELETQLADTEFVIQSLFENALANSQLTSKTVNNTLIEASNWENKLLVLNSGAKQGMKENLKIDLIQSGNIVAKVRVTQVTSDKCVVYILSNEGRPEVLRSGTTISYKFSS